LHDPRYREAFAFPDELPLPPRPAPQPSPPIIGEGGKQYTNMPPEAPREPKFAAKVFRAIYRALLKVSGR
jgi:hypothetical protein